MNHELVFGPLALELNPGAMAGSGSGRGTEPLAVSFNSAAMPDGARAILGSLPGACFGRAPGEAREVLYIGATELDRSTRDCPSAEVLLEAQKCLEREPDRPEIMGVINVTPDSFSDGGKFLDPQSAVEHGLRMASEGASILDVGGESTRPGARAVAEADEMHRVLPVVRDLARQTSARISIDTTKASVARAALDAGATIVNDVSAGEADEKMLDLIAEQGCQYVLMHKRGQPENMQEDPRYDDAPSEVLSYLRGRVAECMDRGIDASRLLVDPGIGFGKRLEHNTALLRRLPELRSLGLPILVGVSRKSFIGHIAGDGADRSRRLGGTAAAVTACVLSGAQVLRVHDVAEMSETIQVATALRWPHSPRSSRAEKGMRTPCPST